MSGVERCDKCGKELPEGGAHGAGGTFCGECLPTVVLSAAWERKGDENVRIQPEDLALADAVYDACRAKTKSAPSAVRVLLWLAADCAGAKGMDEAEFVRRAGLAFADAREVHAELPGAVGQRARAAPADDRAADEWFAHSPGWYDQPGGVQPGHVCREDCAGRAREPH